MFGGVASLIIGLEGEHVISGFMSVYLSNGEPYLKAPYGSMISFWDGTGHYIMYILMARAMDTK